MSVYSNNINQTFQFTRHAQSCNNVNSIRNKVYEPSITYLGIMESINFAKEQAQLGAFTHHNVCVSNLLRTWVTTVLLYGSQMNNKEATTLTLYICPHLKEYVTNLDFVKKGKNIAHKAIDYGDKIGEKTYNIINNSVQPKTNNTKTPINKNNQRQKINNTTQSIERISNEFNKTMNKIIQTGGATITQPLRKVHKFAVKTAKKSIDAIPVVIKKGNWPEPFAISLNRFLQFLNNGHHYNKAWFASLPQKIRFVLPGKGPNGWNKKQRQYVTISKVANYKITNFCNFVDTVGGSKKEAFPGYLQDGDLQEFMKWYNDTNLNIADSQNKVHVVTHSNVMKGYFMQQFDVVKPSPIITKIKENNLARFITSMIESTPPTVLEGKKINNKTKKKAQQLEKQHEDISLCKSKNMKEKAQFVCEKKSKTRKIKNIASMGLTLGTKVAKKGFKQAGKLATRKRNSGQKQNKTRKRISGSKLPLKGAKMGLKGAKMGLKGAKMGLKGAKMGFKLAQRTRKVR